MPRIKPEIQKIRGIRLKQILKEQNLTQTAFADEIHLSQQAISLIINGKTNLNEDIARLIIAKHTEYRFEWLMGYDNYKTDTDEFDSILNERCLREQLRLEGICAIFESMGYQVCPVFSNFTDTCDITQYKETRFKSNSGKIIFDRDYGENGRQFGSCIGYRIVHDHTSIDIDLSEYDQLETSICDFAEFCHKKIIERKGTNNG